MFCGTLVGKLLQNFVWDVRIKVSNLDEVIVYPEMFSDTRQCLQTNTEIGT